MTMRKTLKDARKKLKFIKKKAAPKYDDPAELVAAKVAIPVKF